MNTTSNTVPVIESRPLRKGPRVVVGVLDAGTLIAQYSVPTRDTRRKSGYQRELMRARVNRLQSELRKRRVDLPTAVLLSMRDGSDSLLEDDEKGLRLQLAGRDLSVVDGQHRVAALRDLVDEDPDRWSSFKVPFVCVLGANENQEMEQFYVVNSTAKSVRTDLAYDLLKQQVENDSELSEALEERGEKWKIAGQTIVERLRQESAIWRSLIRFPGDPPRGTTINNSGDGQLAEAAALFAVLRRYHDGQSGQGHQRVLARSSGCAAGMLRRSHGIRDTEVDRSGDHACHPADRPRTCEGSW